APYRWAGRSSLGRRLAVRGLSVSVCHFIGKGSLRRRRGLNSPLVYPGAFPKLASDVDRVNTGLLPPGFFVTGAMHRPVMRAAERDGKFIACFAAERARLHKSDVMRIQGLAAAQEAGLLHRKAEGVPLAIATRCREDEQAFVDAVGLIGVAVC